MRAAHSIGKSTISDLKLSLTLLLKSHWLFSLFLTINVTYDQTKAHWCIHGLSLEGAKQDGQSLFTVRRLKCAMFSTKRGKYHQSYWWRCSSRLETIAINYFTDTRYYLVFSVHSAQTVSKIAVMRLMSLSVHIFRV